MSSSAIIIIPKKGRKEKRSETHHHQVSDAISLRVEQKHYNNVSLRELVNKIILCSKENICFGDSWHPNINARTGRGLKECRDGDSGCKIHHGNLSEG